jgi:hypothetical protein
MPEKETKKREFTTISIKKDILDQLIELEVDFH